MEELKNRWRTASPAVRLAIVAAAAVISIVMVWKILPWIVGGMSIGLLLAVLVLPYWIPTIVAFVRKHPSKGAILALNLLLGWTFVFWVLSLVWSLSDNTSRAGSTVVINNQTAAPQYRVGDVVNGHRFDGVSWSPLGGATPPALENGTSAG